MTKLSFLDLVNVRQGEEAADAIAHPAELSKAAARNAGGAFADWVMESTPAYLGRDTTEDVIIKTTLDPRLQKAAEDALTAVFSTKLKTCRNKFF